MGYYSECPEVQHDVHGMNGMKWRLKYNAQVHRNILQGHRFAFMLHGVDWAWDMLHM
jgi:hypothetical protein